MNDFNTLTFYLAFVYNYKCLMNVNGFSRELLEKLGWLALPSLWHSWMFSKALWDHWPKDLILDDVETLKFKYANTYFLLHFPGLKLKKQKISGSMKDKITSLPFTDLEFYTKNRYGLSSFLVWIGLSLNI